MSVGWCGCCGALRPRYRRLVDNIYPANPDDGLVKANMDKLVWYAMNSPDKLDRIGEYLAHRLYRDIDRRRNGYACVSMDALDQLLVTCHANSLNMFVEFFLKMVQKLLECSEPALQLRGTHSFEKFANIREDTPSYHRRYDFLVSKFSSLCYSNNAHLPTRTDLRTAGIRGLQGVVRKTDWNDLGENIWRPGHMEKMVPSLLFNIADAPALQPGSDPNGGGDVDGGDGGGGEDGGDSTPDTTTKSPPELAESCLRELVARVTFSRIGSVVRPMLMHMDQHKQWRNELMAVHIFKIIMFAIQAQYSINVVDLLMKHLSEHRTDMSRCGIAAVLGQIIPIAAGECVGPSVIEVINSLLEHVRLSMMELVSEPPVAVGGSAVVTMVSQEEQTHYQQKLTHALAEYTSHLPDFHKIEAMLFILTKVPGSERVEEAGSERPVSEIRLQHLLLNCLLSVASRYHASQYYSTFSTAFLARLLRLSVSADAVVRRLILLTLSELLPRSSLPSKPTVRTDELSLPACGMPPVRQDTNFWKKCGHEILASVQDGCQIPNSGPDNYSAAYSVLVQLLVEIRADDVTVDVMRAVMNMQEWCMNKSRSSNVVSLSIHGLVAAVMAVAAAVVPALQPHVSDVIDRREAEAPWLLPSEGGPGIVKGSGAPAPDMLFRRQELVTLLQPTNLNEQRVVGSTSSCSVLRRASSTAGSGGPYHQQTSAGGPATIHEEDAHSAASSPAIPRRDVVIGVEAVPFETLKKAATGAGVSGVASETLKREAEDRRLQTYALLHDSYDALMSRQQADPLQMRLTELLSRLPPCAMPPPAPHTAPLRPLTLQLPYPDIVIC